MTHILFVNFDQTEIQKKSCYFSP